MWVDESHNRRCFVGEDWVYFLGVEVGWSKERSVPCKHCEVAAVFKWDHEISGKAAEASWE